MWFFPCLRAKHAIFLPFDDLAPVSPTDPITRPSLLIRLRDRQNHDAWSEFVAIYQPVIYRMAGRRSAQDADANEIVQEVLMKVANAIDRFDPEANGSFRGWLSQTTRRVAIDRFRSIRLHENAIVPAQDHELNHVPDPKRNEHSDSGLLHEFNLEHRKELFRHAAGQVKTMVNDQTWQAFWETAVQGRNAKQVAQELQLSTGAVYVAKCRVLKRIRQFIESQLSE